MPQVDRREQALGQSPPHAARGRRGSSAWRRASSSARFALRKACTTGQSGPCPPGRGSSSSANSCMRHAGELGSLRSSCSPISNPFASTVTRRRGTSDAAGPSWRCRTASINIGRHAGGRDVLLGPAATTQRLQGCRVVRRHLVDRASSRGLFLLPTFGAPDWVMRVFAAVLILGFLVVPVLAWVFEVTAGRHPANERCAGGAEHPRRHEPPVELRARGPARGRAHLHRGRPAMARRCAGAAGGRRHPRAEQRNAGAVAKLLGITELRGGSAARESVAQSR